MFYLTQLGVLFKRGAVSYLINLSLAIALMLSVGHFDQLNQRLAELVPKEVATNYFHALVSDRKNVARIARKMRRLPGVESVVLTSQEELAGQVKTRIAKLEISLRDDLMTTSFQGLKVIFENGVGQRSMELIRNYLKRLAGEGSVTIGDTHLEGEKDLLISSLLSRLKRWSSFFLVGLVAIFWMLSLQLLAGRVWQKAYLLEQYQRRHRVAIKLISLHGVATLAISLVIILPFGLPSPGNVAILLGIVALGVVLQLRRNQWGAQG